MLGSIVLSVVYFNGTHITANTAAFFFVDIFTERIFDCYDLTASGITTSGVYTLLSDDAWHWLVARDAYCDLETDGGG